MKSAILYIIFVSPLLIGCNEKSKVKSIAKEIYVISKQDNLQSLSFK